MHREELVVQIVAEKIVFRDRQLRAHHQREYPGQQEKQECGADIEHADIGVVDDRDEPESRRRFPDFLELFQLGFRPGCGIRKFSDGVALFCHRVSYRNRYNTNRPAKYTTSVTKESIPILPMVRLRRSISPIR